MFRKNKKENKSKLEHKLYLARETPEPIFDLSECGLQTVPSGIYSLCRVFLKDCLNLGNNNLSSLSGGGNLKELHLLKVLNLNNNSFSTLPNDLDVLKSVVQLHISNNQLKKLPTSICSLRKLEVLDISNNKLQSLPDDLGDLYNIRSLNICGNKLTALPKSICKCKRLTSIQLDHEKFVYPTPDVASREAQEIIKYICDDTGYVYEECEQPNDVKDENVHLSDSIDSFQAKLWTLEHIKEQKLQEFMAIEKRNEIMQRQEIELANSLKSDKRKLLKDLAQEQSKFDTVIARLHQEKELDRFRLIEQLQSAEQNADIAIGQLLLLNREPSSQLMDQEKFEMEKFFTVAHQHGELHRNEVLAAMKNLIEQETNRCKELDESRIESTKSILEQEMHTNAYLSNILQSAQEERSSELIMNLQKDSELQKAAVGALLERGDARSWGLVQHVRLVESQLAALTVIEMDRKKLEMDQQLSDLVEKRANLSKLLTDLLDQQKIRREQLISSLKNLENDFENVNQDFWLRQYQQLLDRMPTGVLEIRKNINPNIADALLMSGVIHCIPFLAKWSHNEYKLLHVTDEDLRTAGITNSNERKVILETFYMCRKQREQAAKETVAPSAPVDEYEPTAPAEEVSGYASSDCVICLDILCEVIFVPCGHLCCCGNCSSSLRDCPMCRTYIERKIRVIAS